MSADTNIEAERGKQAAAWSSVLAAVFLTTLKVVVGLLTGSLGILAEAAHSGLDLVAALVTLFAVRLSDRPPDEGHLYGHGKIENLSALIETLLLLVTCVWIIYEAIQRLFFKQVEVEASIWAFGVMATSIAVDVSRSRMLYRAAEKHHSQALEADALHFSTDVWSSAVVIVGLGLVWLSQQLGREWAWLVKADAVAALMVAVIVIYVSLQLGRRAVSVLLDAAPPGLVREITARAGGVPGVQSLGPVRVRQAGPATFVDLSVNVNRSASLEEAHKIATTVEARISALVHQGDVVVHVDPVQQQGESLPQAVGAIADRMGMRSHNVHAHEVRGRYFVDLDVEVPPSLTLAEAHERASHLEALVRQELPYVADVHTHIEPLSVPVVPEPLATGVDAELEAKILGVVEKALGHSACPEIHLRPGQDGYDAVLHCLADPDLPIAEAHRLAEQVKQQVHTQVPGMAQVLVHMEPAAQRLTDERN